MKTEQIESLKEIAEEKNLITKEQKKEIIKLKNSLNVVDFATLFTICDEIFYSVKKELTKIDKSYDYTWGAELRNEVLKIKKIDGGIGTSISERKINEIAQKYKKDMNEFISLFFEVMEIEDE